MKINIFGLVFFIALTLVLQLDRLLNLGFDDKAIHYTYAQGQNRGFSEFIELRNRLPFWIENCRGESRCEYRTRLRLSAFPNYPLVSAGIGLFSLPATGTANCKGISQAIWYGMILAAQLCFLGFLFFYFFSSCTNQQVFLGGFFVAALIFFSPITGIRWDSLYLPSTNILAHPLGVAPRCLVGLITVLGLSGFFSDRPWIASIAGLVNAGLHFGQATFANFFLGLVVLLWWHLRQKPFPWRTLLILSLTTILPAVISKITLLTEYSASNISTLLSIAPWESVVSLVPVLMVASIWFFLELRRNPSSLISLLSGMVFLALVIALGLRALVVATSYHLPVDRRALVGELATRFEGNLVPLFLLALLWKPWCTLCERFGTRIVTIACTGLFVLYAFCTGGEEGHFRPRVLVSRLAEASASVRGEACKYGDQIRFPGNDGVDPRKEEIANLQWADFIRRYPDIE